MKGKVALALIALAIVIALGLPIRERTERAEADLFETWRGGPAQAKVAAIEAYFARDKVGDVLPLADILRSDARWRTCPSAAPFAVPPSAHWPAMAKTLRYLREHLVPAFGPVRVVSGYREPAANLCFKGAKASRHLRFAALDLIPVRPMPRSELIENLCALHARTGQRHAVGLGIYSAARFYIDTAGYRRWDGDYRAASSPCGASR
ncbi:D-Ala-D-Ala carboxypeptidase family metallohydrolase [Sphingopyxis sp. 113P3]|uniref:D-Ala-D-Ala carboxypeptidase family metallohydrolase n=1 Tax=Sphingopyxis sp. (strain 113P3) TaxID=292913 RepID=UPI0006AD532D|nr:D-Ala-D-Ala carboxypeptidase family metallohydrolase [Sphingopyxis sp. 113P3]ALC13756.1 hypothetical protein LH20_17485 [Sphingopyxis sp. 113P3]